MPTYTLSQPKSGFPTIHQHGKPWLAVEDAEKARAIVEAMNHVPETAPTPTSEMATWSDNEWRRRIQSDLYHLFRVQQNIRSRVYALETSRRRSIFGWR